MSDVQPANTSQTANPPTPVTPISQGQVPANESPVPSTPAIPVITTPVVAPPTLTQRAEIPVLALAGLTLAAIVVLLLNGNQVPDILYTAFIGLIIGGAGITIPGFLSK